MAYYKLDASGYIVGVFSHPNANTQELPEAPNLYYRWDGSEWVREIGHEVSLYRQEKIDFSKYMYSNNWIEFSRTLNYSQILDAYDDFIVSAEAATTEALIDAAYGTLVSTLWPE